jgi:ribosomal protein S18 acetylase RimI-like enzyme
MNVTFRPSGEDDIEFLISLYSSTRAVEVASWGWSPEQQTNFLRMQFTAQRTTYKLAYAGADDHIILVHERPVGRMMVLRSPVEIRLVDIALMPEFQGKGIGSQLIRELLEEADESGKIVRLQVTMGNRARALYEKLGFSSCGDDGVYCQMERFPDKSRQNR